MLVVRGPAGIGKSRPVREFGSEVKGAGGTVLTGRCSPTATVVPLRPLREALLAVARSGLRPSGDLAPFLPTLGALVPDWSARADVTAERAPIVLAEGLLRGLAEWSTPQAATLLELEDVHWSDPETLTVIEYLADNLAGQPILVVAVIREGHAGAGADLMATLEASSEHRFSLVPDLVRARIESTGGWSAVGAAVSHRRKIVNYRRAVRACRVTRPRREVEDSRPLRRGRAQRVGSLPPQGPRETSGSGVLRPGAVWPSAKPILAMT
jgi:hypothetical protein